MLSVCTSALIKTPNDWTVKVTVAPAKQACIILFYYLFIKKKQCASKKSQISPTACTKHCLYYTDIQQHLFFTVAYTVDLTSIIMGGHIILSIYIIIKIYLNY